MADPTRRSTRFSMRSKQLGQLLVENGDVQADQIAQALKLQEQQGGLLGYILREQNWCGENAIVSALLKQVQVTDVKCEELYVPPEVASLVPRETCEMEKLCPFERIGNMLCVVMGNPLNRKAISQIEESTRLKVKSFKAVWPRILELIERTYTEEAAAAAAPAGDELSLDMPGAEEPALALEDPAAPQAIDDALALDDGPPPPAPPPAPRPAASIGTGAPPRQGGTSKRLKPVDGPRIKGLENLSDDNAEMIDTERAPRRKQASGRFTPLGKKKDAKVNVDLDQLDITQGEVVEAAGDEQLEGHDEIVSAAPLPATRRILGERFVEIKPVRDGYFYADGNAPAERTDQLWDLIDTLPKAQVVAQSIGEFERQEREKKKSALAPAVALNANRPVEYQPAPLDPVRAELISEADFNRLTASMKEDPVGEWDGAFSGAGPVGVNAYED